MRVPSNHPLAEATLNVVRASFPARETKFKLFHEANLEDFEYTLQANGVMIIRPKDELKESKRLLTLSIKAHFNILPVLTVNAIRGQILQAGSRPTAMGTVAGKSIDAQLIAKAKLSVLRKELSA